MEKVDLTPEESLLLISRTIEETKKKFQENGHILILWGCLTFIVFLSQYVLVFLGLHTKFDIFWTSILFPLGAIYTFFYYRRKIGRNNIPGTVIGRILGTMGWIVGINLMILGFIFGHQLGEAIAPVFLVMLAFLSIMVGVSINFRPLTIGGILMNLTAFASFFVSTDFHGLSMMIGAVVGLIIPGILLNRANKEENV